MIKSKTQNSFGLALLSAAVLIFEIALTRLFAIQQFHHFAFMVVSLAVMGFAASGFMLTLLPKNPPLSQLTAGFSLSIAIAYLIINFLPFDSYSITWDGKQAWILMLYFAAAGLPFLFAGWAIGAALAHAGTGAHLPYAANLIGSALGCPIALIAMDLLGGERTIVLSMLLGLLSGFLFLQRRKETYLHAILTSIILLGLLWLPPQLQLRLSPYKPLVITQLAADANHTTTVWSSSSRVDVVETNTVHVLPGLSLNAPIDPPPQAAVFIDGEGPIPITALAPREPAANTIAEHMPTSLAYRLRPGAKTLILQPGGGFEAIIALSSGAGRITLPTDEPLIHELMMGEYREFSENLLSNPGISISDRSSRGTLETPGQSYDLVILALSESFHPVTSGAFSLMENYLLTVEAFSQALGRLNQDGMFVITRWLGTPPSESARTWAILLSALKASGIPHPEAHLIAYRGMRTATLIASKRPFTPEEYQLAETFLESNAFDPVYFPGLDSSQFNRFNHLPKDVYYEVYYNLLTNPEETLNNYYFNLRPPTDDRPFFFHFFRWRQTPQVLATLGRVWQPFGGSGYLVLLALLALMVLLALPLGLAPLFLLRSRHPSPYLNRKLPAYFAFLGAGYLLIEIPLIQKMTLLLDRPATALAAVLFGLLLSSGVGSYFSPRVHLRLSLGLLIGLLVALNFGLEYAVALAMPSYELFRFIYVVFLIAPIGFLMGIPFASGLRELEKRLPGMIPWAWAINGATSGVIGVVAAMITLDWGMRATMGFGALAYVAAFLTAPYASKNIDRKELGVLCGPRQRDEANTAQADGFIALRPRTCNPP